MKGPSKADTLVKVHTNLFLGDVEYVKAQAAQQNRKWQIELRHLFRRAVELEKRREITLLKEHR